MSGTVALRKLFIPLIFCFFLQRAVAWRPFTIHLDKVECEAKNDMTYYVNCSITKNIRSGGRLNFSGKLRKPVTALGLDLAIMNSRHKMNQFVVVNITNYDGCQLLASQSGLTILQILFKHLKKYSNLPKQCPVKQGYELFIRKFVVNPDSFPPYLPDTQFTIMVNLLDHKIEFVSVLVSGSVEHKKDAGNHEI